MDTETRQYFNDRFEDLKQHVSYQIGDLKSSVEVRCNECTKTSILNEKVKSLKIHVSMIWAVIGGAAATVFQWMRS